MNSGSGWPLAFLYRSVAFIKSSWMQLMGHRGLMVRWAMS